MFVGISTASFSGQLLESVIDFADITNIAGLGVEWI